MSDSRSRTICWTPIWNKDREGVGLEHLLLSECVADSVVLAYDQEHGPFRLTYRLTWDESWRLRDAELVLATERSTRSLSLQTDGRGHWRYGDGRAIDDPRWLHGHRHLANPIHQQLPDSPRANGYR